MAFPRSATCPIPLTCLCPCQYWSSLSRMIVQGPLCHDICLYPACANPGVIRGPQALYLDTCPGSSCCATMSCFETCLLTCCLTTLTTHQRRCTDPDCHAGFAGSSSCPMMSCWRSWLRPRNLAMCSPLSRSALRLSRSLSLLMMARSLAWCRLKVSLCIKCSCTGVPLCNMRLACTHTLLSQCRGWGKGSVDKMVNTQSSKPWTSAAHLRCTAAWRFRWKLTIGTGSTVSCVAKLSDQTILAHAKLVSRFCVR